MLHSARRVLNRNSLRVQIPGRIFRENCGFCCVGHDAWIVLDCPQYLLAAVRKVPKLTMGISRTRSAGAKVTEEEYTQLEALAQTRGLTVGEWCREVLLAQLKPPVASLPEETLLAEVVGLRMIMINLLHALGSGEPLTAEKTQTVIDWADREKIATAVEYLREHTARNKP